MTQYISLSVLSSFSGFAACVTLLQKKRTNENVSQSLTSNLIKCILPPSRLQRDLKKCFPNDWGKEGIELYSEHRTLDVLSILSVYSDSCDCYSFGRCGVIKLPLFTGDKCTGHIKNTDRKCCVEIKWRVRLLGCLSGEERRESTRIWPSQMRKRDVEELQKFFQQRVELSWAELSC